MPPHDDEPLRVALDATPLLGPVTGVGQFCAGALDALGRRPGLEVSAFAVSWRRRRGIEGRLPAGVRRVGRPMPARPLHLAWRHLRGPALELFCGRLDVVHGTNFVVPPTRRAARVVTVHDLTTLRFPQLCQPATLRFPALVRRAVRQGAWVHTPSRFVADEVVEAMGADPARVVAVAHGIPSLPEAPPPPLPPGPYVLSLGTLEPRKDVPGLLRAFELVAPSHPELLLVVAGPDGWGTAAFQQALGRCRFADRVVRLGYLGQAERAGLLRGAAVFAYPSIYEGFGLPPLEAMAVGVPVVCTRAGALPEVVDSAALMVEPGDPEALAGALARLLDDQDARLALIEAGQRRATQFSWQACADGLEDLYRRAVAER